MKKKIIYLFILSISILAILFFLLNGLGKASLVSTHQTAHRSVGGAEDFVLHIRVEDADGKIKVYRSIQYKGEKPIEIEHQTPLISVSLDQPNHDFTGSTVKEEMKKGDSYYPQSAKIIKIPERGVYTLYCLAKFQIDGVLQKIEYEEELTFQ